MIGPEGDPEVSPEILGEKTKLEPYLITGIDHLNDIEHLKQYLEKLSDDKDSLNRIYFDGRVDLFMKIRGRHSVTSTFYDLVIQRNFTENGFALSGLELIASNNNSFSVKVSPAEGNGEYNGEGVSSHSPLEGSHESAAPAIEASSKKINEDTVLPILLIRGEGMSLELVLYNPTILGVNGVDIAEATASRDSYFWHKLAGAYNLQLEEIEPLYASGNKKRPWYKAIDPESKAEFILGCTGYSVRLQAKFKKSVSKTKLKFLMEKHSDKGRGPYNRNSITLHARTKQGIEEYLEDLLKLLRN